jgi:hypothetical protein
MMDCPNCGKEIPDTAKVCGYCGQKVPEKIKTSDIPVLEVTQASEAGKGSQADVEAVNISNLAENLNQIQEVTKPQKSKKNWLFLLLGGLFAVLIDFLAGFLTGEFNFPIYLDSIGTAGFAVLAGPLAGSIVGILFCLLTSLTYFSDGYYFSIVHVLIAFAAWGAYRLGWMKKAGLAILGGAITGFLVPILGSLIVMFLYDAEADRTLNAFFQHYIQGIKTDVPDKVVIFLIVWAFLLVVGNRKRIKN